MPGENYFCDKIYLRTKLFEWLLECYWNAIGVLLECYWSGSGITVWNGLEGQSEKKHCNTAAARWERSDKLVLAAYHHCHICFPVPMDD